MLRRTLMIGLLLASAGSGAAEDRSAVFGLWATKDSILEIGEAPSGTSADGTLHATIVAMLNPLYNAAEEGTAGTPRVDLKNPSPELRARPILGMNLLSGYQFKDGKWQGQIYDARSGKTYKSQMTLGSDGKLKMRGYIGAPMFGQTEEFEPVASCAGAIPKMLADAKLESTC
jgi:uncharacterized protein (DUF2147 family)